MVKRMLRKVREVEGAIAGAKTGALVPVSFNFSAIDFSWILRALGIGECLHAKNCLCCFPKSLRGFEGTRHIELEYSQRDK